MDANLSDANTLVVAISAAYALTGVIRIVSYCTQLRALWADDTGAKSTSLSTWAGFFLVWLIGAAYGAVVLDDWPVVFVSLCGACGSALILGLATLRRLERRRTNRVR